MGEMRQAFKASVNIQFDHNLDEDGISEEAIGIDDRLIKYILVEYMYQSRHMPVIFLSLSLKNDLYTMVINDRKRSEFYLTIKIYNALSDNSIDKTTIKGRFSYIPSTDNPNYTNELEEESKSVDTSYKTIVLALLSMDLMNQSKTSFNGIFSNISEATLMTKVLGNKIDYVIKPLDYNAVFDTIVIPPLTSKYEMLNFFFQKNPFYDTEFVFFLDFNKRGYLIDWSGDQIDANDGKPSKVIINIKRVTAAEAYYEGIVVGDDYYQLYINPANTNLNIDKASDNTANQMVFVDDDGEVNSVDLNVNNAVGSSVKRTFRRGGSANLYKNIAESDYAIIEIMKENVSTDIFTPNKIYILQNDDDNYKQYDGKYSLVYKDQVIKNNNGEFGLSILIGLRKVSENIVPLGKKFMAKAEAVSSNAATRYRGAVRGKYTSKGNKKKSKVRAKKVVIPTRDRPNEFRNRRNTRLMYIGRRSDNFVGIPEIYTLTDPERILPKITRINNRSSDTEELLKDIQLPDPTKKQE